MEAVGIEGISEGTLEIGIEGGFVDSATADVAEDGAQAGMTGIRDEPLVEIFYGGEPGFDIKRSALGIS